MKPEDDPDNPDAVPVQDFLDELRDRFERVEMSWDPINLQVTVDPEFVLGILERVPEVPPTPDDGTRIEPLRLSLGHGLERVMRSLPKWYPELQRHTRLKLGLELPELFMWVDPGLPSMAWTIDLHEEVSARGHAGTELMLARGPVHGLDGLPSKLGVWIRPELETVAVRQGCEVVDVVIASMLVQLHQVVLRRSCDLLSLDAVQRMVERVRKTNPLLVEQLIPEKLTWAVLQEILQNLLREQVPIRDLRRILEVLLRNVRRSQQAMTLTEFARYELSRSICRRLSRQGQLHVIGLHQELETRIFEASQLTEQGRVLSPDTASMQSILECINRALPAFSDPGMAHVLLTSPRVRPLLRRLTERNFPALAVLSWNEIPPGVRVHELGVVQP